MRLSLNSITYFQGGDNKLSFDLAYNDNTRQLKSMSQPISQCVGSSTEGAKASALVVTSASYGGGSINAGSDFALTVDVLASGGTVGAEKMWLSTLRCPADHRCPAAPIFLWAT